jgi:hypothetical protein
MITTYPLHLAAQLSGSSPELVHALFASKSPPSALVKDSLGCTALSYVRFFCFRQKFALEDAIGSHACSLEASERVTNDIPLGCSLLLPIDTINSVATLKAIMWSTADMVELLCMVRVLEQNFALGDAFGSYAGCAPEALPRV